MVEAGRVDKENDVDIIEELYLEKFEMERTTKSTETENSEVEAEEQHGTQASKRMIDGYFGFTQEQAYMLQEHNMTSKASIIALKTELLDCFNSARNTTT